MLAMDREEAFGLTAAIGGHAVLLAILVLGIFASKQVLESSPSLEVSLDGFTGPIGGGGEEANVPMSEVEPAPLPAEPEEAPSEEATQADDAQQEADVQAVAARQAEAEAKRAEEAARQNANDAAAQRRAAEQRKKAEAAKRAKAEAAKRAKQKVAAQKAARAKAARAKAAREKAAREAAARKARDKALAGAVGGGGSNPFSRAVQGRARTTIGGQIRISGCPNGLDVNKIVTTVTINLKENGNIASLTGISQKGRTASNAPQMAPTKNCILSSIRNSAPFRGLEKKDYASWKKIRIGFRAN